MADGGFLIRFNGKDVKRCYKVEFCYDDWNYSVNGAPAMPLPDDLKDVQVVVEKTEERF